MARVVPFPSERERVFTALSPDERDFIEHLLRIAPNYQYELSGLPTLDPTPAPGLQSAIAVAKAVLTVHAGWASAL
jgi:hypothetical protein